MNWIRKADNAEQGLPQVNEVYEVHEYNGTLNVLPWCHFPFRNKQSNYMGQIHFLTLKHPEDFRRAGGTSTERDSYRQPWLAMVTSNHDWLFFDAIMVSNGKFRQLANPFFFSVLTSAIGNSWPAFC